MEWLSLGTGGPILTDLADSNSGSGSLISNLKLTAITGGTTGHSAASSSNVVTAAQSETVTVSYAITDTISSLAGNIQTALRAAGAIGNSTLTGGTLAAATAAQSSGILTLTAVGADAKISSVTSSTDGGTANKLAVNLNLNGVTAANAFTASGAAVQNKYRLDSIALTGVTSISSSSTGSIDISTQTAA
ncbi:MAG: hypothetical protein EBT09_15080, partial [Actinobacteria bacterium]|nr:hypothetical protein [Actinomycetota bacterium]